MQCSWCAFALAAGVLLYRPFGKDVAALPLWCCVSLGEVGSVSQPRGTSCLVKPAVLVACCPPRRRAYGAAAFKTAANFTFVVAADGGYRRGRKGHAAVLSEERQPRALPCPILSRLPRMGAPRRPRPLALHELCRHASLYTRSTLHVLSRPPTAAGQGCCT